MQKVVVEGKGHEGVRQLPEPTFNKTCDGVDGVVVQGCPLRIWCHKTEHNAPKAYKIKMLYKNPHNNRNKECIVSLKHFFKYSIYIVKC